MKELAAPAPRMNGELRLGRFCSCDHLKIGVLDDESRDLFLKVVRIRDSFSVKFNCYEFDLKGSVNRSKLKRIRKALAYDSIAAIIAVRDAFDLLLEYCVRSKFPELEGYVENYEIKSGFIIAVNRNPLNGCVRIEGQEDAGSMFYRNLRRILNGETVLTGRPPSDHDAKGLQVSRVCDPVARQLILLAHAVKTAYAAADEQPCIHDEWESVCYKSNPSCMHCAIYRGRLEELLVRTWDLAYACAAKDLINPMLLRRNAHGISKRHSMRFDSNWNVVLVEQGEVFEI